MMTSLDLAPGMRLAHERGKVVTISHRKEAAARSGWWLTDGSGLADVVIDNPAAGWTLIGLQ